MFCYFEFSVLLFGFQLFVILNLVFCYFDFSFFVILNLVVRYFKFSFLLF